MTSNDLALELEDVTMPQALLALGFRAATFATLTAAFVAATPLSNPAIKIGVRCIQILVADAASSCVAEHILLCYPKYVQIAS